VLALGKEQRLDPLPDFITDPASRLVVRDTRNLVFGRLAFAEAVGGAGGEGEKGGLFERFTVRRSFKPVPYYEPALAVGADGIATVQVKLPDDLTTFKLRAKAASGPDRFGWATGEIAVRQPLIVQPALPRFVRPGDKFTAAGIGRIVEGEGGPGSAEVRVAGATLGGEARREIAWAPERPERIEFPVEVTTPPYDAAGRLARTEVAFGVAVARASDGAGDAFEVKLPIRDDRERTTVRLLSELRAGQPVAVPAIPEPARPGTVRRTLVVSDQPALLRMAAGLDFLAEYPYGCTEQRISRAHAFVALRGFRALLAEEGGEERVARPVREVLEWLPLVVDEHGLCAYWPGGRGSVSLTAWTVQFLADARDAGFAVDAKLVDTLTGALEHALRSDYAYFIDGEAFVERAFALGALARVGKFNPGYAAELARRAQYLDAEGVAEVVLAFARQGDTASSTVEALVQRLWDAVVVRLHEGKERYGGLQRSPAGRNGLIVPSETRTLAEITQAVAHVGPDAPRLPLLVDALVTLGRGDGWGSTNANAAALRALAERVRTGGTPHSIDVRVGADARTVALGPDAPIVRLTSTAGEAGEVSLGAADGGVVGVRLETTWIPAADGSQVAAQASGFVVAREWLRVAKGTDAPPERFALAAPGTVLAATVGDVRRGPRPGREPRRPPLRRDRGAARGGHGADEPEARDGVGGRGAGRQGDGRADVRGVPRRPGRVLLRHAAEGHARPLLPHARDDRGALHPARRRRRDDVRRERARDVGGRGRHDRRAARPAMTRRRAAVAVAARRPRRRRAPCPARSRRRRRSSCATCAAGSSTRSRTRAIPRSGTGRSRRCRRASSRRRSPSRTAASGAIPGSIHRRRPDGRGRGARRAADVGRVDHRDAGRAPPVSRAADVPPEARRGGHRVGDDGALRTRGRPRALPPHRAVREPDPRRRVRRASLLRQARRRSQLGRVGVPGRHPAGALAHESVPRAPAWRGRSRAAGASSTGWPPRASSSPGRTSSPYARSPRSRSRRSRVAPRARSTPRSGSAASSRRVRRPVRSSTPISISTSRRRWRRAFARRSTRSRRAARATPRRSSSNAGRAASAPGSDRRATSTRATPARTTTPASRARRAAR
jgi:hypothetical protein